MRVALFGGTGFVGGYLVNTLVAAGHEPSVLIRPGSENKLTSRDECRVTAGDISSVDAIEATLEGCDALIYNIGILKAFPRKGITFEELHFEGVRRVVNAAQMLNIRRVLLMSGNGAKSPGTPYQDTKFRADEFVRQSGLECTVFRPSVIFGNSEGQQEISHQLHQDLVKPPIPAVAFHTGWTPKGNGVVMSPVHVQDVADAFVGALSNPATVGKTFVLGGPEILTWEEMIQRVAAAVGRRKWMLPMPVGLMRFAATLFDWLPFFPATRDQLTMLAEGNVADSGELATLINRPPTAFVPENLSYLS